MRRHFLNLRKAMMEADMTQADLGERINRSAAYISERLLRKKPWTLDECYLILRVLQLDEAEFTKYFPKR